ncbi:hypothetical protein PCC7424_1831 [Gloeothece citriformis PCC 7424]|uniref:5-bromo-4-chloroindolyl phosphate hydrolysis protein n=1 Tax=Gloeothece citriformis (strain PCC 7424) TaxID=65393 RepID=B7KCF8_GLOC7|nr:hypothetical protein [Gloeothece citriformis]ACK70263.1 hypothetical protein PCC7424_1831 [Gloeothece citriformis PCC 7424]
MYHHRNTILWWRKIFRLPQTYFLIVGTLLGYLSFIIYLGMRPITLIIGGAIALLMLVAWMWQLKQINLSGESDLLEREVFFSQLETINPKIRESASSQWKQTLDLASETQVFAQRIASQQLELIPELLEALYTVIALCNEVAQAHLALNHIQTDTYRQLTQHCLKSSIERLKDTHNQLQQLQDQVLLSSLETSQLEDDFPTRLRSLIAENKTTLQTLMDKSSIESGS